MINFSMDLNIKDFEEDTLHKAQQVLFLSMTKMEALAKRRCPVDTGILRSSIHLLPKELSSNYQLADGVDYGYLVEYGTINMINAHGEHDPEHPVTDWKAKRERNAIGQTLPFMRPAMLEVKRIWLDRYYSQIFL